MADSTHISMENRDLYIILGLNISYYRKLAGMTQEQLSERAGISRTFLGEIEAPNLVKSMSLEVLFNLARALGVSASKLVEVRE